MAQKTNYNYNSSASIRCSNCGSIYTTGSTIDSLTIDVCGNCHPFYTGQDSIVDTAGRIEKFQSRLSKAQATPKSEKKKKTRKTFQSIFDLQTQDNQ